MSLREMLFYHIEKAPTHVGRHIVVKRRVEPNDLSASVSSVGTFECCDREKTSQKFRLGFLEWWSSRRASCWPRGARWPMDDLER